MGYPGYTTPASDEVFNTFIIPQMFAAAARGGSAEDAVSAAEAQINQVFEKWRSQGKI